MKIFNWVHRRFNHKDGMVAQNGRKTEQFLLENNGGVFDAWKGGILAIGTFGYDPLPKEGSGDNKNGVMEEVKGMQVVSDDLLAVDNSVIDQIDCLQFQEEEDDEKRGDCVKGMIGVDESEEEEVNPLMMYAASCDYSSLLAMKESGEKCASAMKGEQLEVTKKERTTLAELFSAEKDGDDGMKKGQIKAMAVKPTGNKAATGRMALAKKIMGEDARPAIHKLNRFMRRMLNRKIHPDHVVFAAVHDHNPNLNPAASTHREVVPKRHSS